MATKQKKETTSAETSINITKQFDLETVGSYPNISDMDPEEARNMLGDLLDEFKTTVEGADLDQLKSAEQIIIEVQDKYQSSLLEKQYELKSKVKFDSKTFTKEVISEMITDFLNKLEVRWEQTLGMYQLVNFWNNSKTVTTIPYGVYDSTLRCLNQLSFKGLKQWQAILAVNEYLKSNHVEYSKDIMITYFLAQKHDIIMHRMELISPMQGAE